MDPMREEARSLLAFNHVPGIGPARIAALRARFGSAAAAWRASAADLGGVLDRRSLAETLAARASLDIETVVARLRTLDIRVVTIDDAGYPPLLATIPGAPYVLYTSGEVSLLSGPCVAIVGARKASDYGRVAARRLSADLAARGVAVVSGLAHGIDTEAHRAALDATGRTIAVLGCGPDIVYPERNRRLRDEIARVGCVVSELAPGTPPTPGSFPARNRIVSGLSLATIVVEAGSRSGALITAKCAAEQGRDVFAVPGSIFSSGHTGANELLAAGAGVARSAVDVLESLGLPCEPVAPPSPPSPEDAAEAAILAELGQEPVHIDALSRRLGRRSSDIARALAVLELRGAVRHTGGMRWVVS